MLIFKPYKVLYPLSTLYSFITSFRNKCYDFDLIKSNKSKIPVISVGNITVGGSGKSPFSSFLAKELFLLGLKPVILLRGYGGEIKTAHLVTKENTALEVGDEALMHLFTLEGISKVVVSKNRSLGARYIEKNNLGNIIILDDGFQHRRLKRNLDILLIDVSSLESIETFKNGNLLPSGFLRESKKDAFKRANIIIGITRDIKFTNSIKNLKEELGILEKTDFPIVEIAPSYFLDVLKDKKLDLNFFRNKELIALSAIAKPKLFLNMLKNLGIKIKKEYFYRDHYFYKKSDIENILKENKNASIITTTKDLVKLIPLSPSKKNLNLYALILDIKFNKKEEYIKILNRIKDIIF